MVTTREDASEVTGEELRRVMSAVPTPITFLGALDPDGQPRGFIVGSFTSVSLDPPLVGAFIQRVSTTWPALREARALGVSVLATGHDAQVRQLVGPAAQRFAGVPYRVTPGGAVLIEGASATLEVELTEEVATGDHLLALLGVRHVAQGDATSLVFHDSTVKLLEG